MFDVVQIELRDLLTVTVLLAVAIFFGGLWLGSYVSRKHVNELLEVVKDLVSLFRDGPGGQHKKNIEALVDFSMANLVWHLAPSESETEEHALHIITKSLSRMDDDVRTHTMKSLEKSREVLEIARDEFEKEQAKQKANGDV